MDPLLSACILGGLFLALLGLFWGCCAWVVSREQRAGAAELAREADRRQAAEALAAHRAELLHEAQELLADASRGDQALASLAAELGRVPAGGDPRERAERLLLARIAARPRRAGGPGPPGPSSPAPEPDGAPGLGA